MNTRQKVYDMLDDFSTAMLVTAGGGGPLDARPMHLAEVEPMGSIWLVTSAGTRKTGEIAGDPHVLVICQDERSRYLSLRGLARVTKDPARVRRLWREAYRIWFPGGPEDPDIELIAVDPESAEFWDETGRNRLEYIWEAAKAYAGGDRPDAADAGRHGRTKL